MRIDTLWVASTILSVSLLGGLGPAHAQAPMFYQPATRTMAVPQDAWLRPQLAGAVIHSPKVAQLPVALAQPGFQPELATTAMAGPTGLPFATQPMYPTYAPAAAVASVTQSSGPVPLGMSLTNPSDNMAGKEYQGPRTPTEAYLDFNTGWGSRPAPSAMAASYTGLPPVVGPPHSAAGPIARASFSDGLSGCPACGGLGCPMCVVCSQCGGAGCDACQINGVWSAHGPNGDGGCCRPRWFDVYVGAVFLQRGEVSSLKQFTRRGITLPSDIVLTTNNLDFDDHELGMRITTSHLIGPGSHLEVSYLGMLNWEETAVVRDTNHNLYSVFSQFGTSPGLPPPGSPVGPGFVQTDQATEHIIDYSGDFNSAEMNLRSRWITPECRFHYSLLAGVRYVRVVEDFLHRTSVLAHDDPFTGDSLAEEPPDPLFNNPFERGPASLSYLINARNDLIGFQIGGDAFACVFPGLMLGADAKAGIYGNHTQQDTLIRYTNAGGDEIRERRSDEDISTVLEANLQCIWRMGQHVTLRGGYTVMHIQNVALAPDQFDGTPPNIFFPEPAANRTPVINSHGKIFYFGYLGGIEWTW